MKNDGNNGIIAGFKNLFGFMKSNNSIDDSHLVHHNHLKEEESKHKHEGLIRPK
jgi:hypothetical protein